MAINVMHWVMEHSTAPSPGPRLVLLAIADNCDSGGGHAFPTLGEIGRKAALSPSAVRRAIATLETTGELVVDRSGPRHVYSITMYTIAPNPEGR